MMPTQGERLGEWQMEEWDEVKSFSFSKVLCVVVFAINVQEY